MRKKIIYGLLMALGLFVAGAIGAITVTTFNIVDLIGVATSPGNPTSGKGRLYFSTADSKLHCLTNGGANCLSGGGGGGVCPAGAAGNLQYTDGTNCASTNELNYNAGGDTLLFQPAIQEYFAIGGTIQMRSGPTGANLFQIDGVNGFTIQAADTAPANNVEFNATGEIDLSAPLIQETVGNASPVIPGSIIQRSVTTSPNPIVSTDRGNRVVYNSASAVAVSLAQAGTGAFAGGFNTHLANQNAGAVTITPTTSTINGAATLVLSEGQWCLVNPSSAGTDYAADCTESPLVQGTNMLFTRGVHTLTIGTSLTPSFTSIGCGVLNTTGCVITGFGATSGSATITFPPVGGTVGSAFQFSNNITVPGGSSTGVWGAQNSLFGNTITKYNNINTTGNGVPAIYGVADLTGQTAAKTATTLVTPTNGGLVRVTVYLKVTTAASVSSVLGGATGVKITYTDNTDSVAQSVTVMMQTEAGVSGISNAGNATTSVLTGSVLINAKNAVAVQYAIDYTSSGTAMAYEAHLKSEAL